MKARILTNQQVELIIETEFNSQGNRFNILLNEDDQLCVMESCVEACEFSQYNWLKECPLIDFKPKPLSLLLN
jgi:hypothetical protein